MRIKMLLGVIILTGRSSCNYASRNYPVNPLIQHFVNGSRFSLTALLDYILTACANGLGMLIVRNLL